MSALQKIVNVEEVYLDKPGVEKGYSYVIEELTIQGVKIDEEAKKCIREKALPNMVSRKTYTGYKSLNAFLGRLSLESAIAADSGEYRLDTAVINSILEKIEKEEELEKSDSRRIGFSV